ncbi:hypothetical protein [Flavobacterium sp. HJSW_4]|uniref:hypothetical protein n=1 Tax=Flavobacterium sp. HJSW_4 TaxID=3344660 RepID=UPI0035F3AD44
MELGRTGTMRTLGIYKIIQDAPRFNFLLYISGLLFNVLCLAALVFDFYEAEIFSGLLISNGFFMIIYYFSNKRKVIGLELLLQSGVFALCIGIITLFDCLKILNVNDFFLFYFFSAGLVNLMLASSLGLYGMIDWNSFKNFSIIVILLSIAGFLFIVYDLPGGVLFLVAASISYGCARIKLALNFSELSRFPQKVSQQIYLKIEGAKNEYFEALKKNWDADEDLYL